MKLFTYSLSAALLLAAAAHAQQPPVVPENQPIKVETAKTETTAPALAGPRQLPEAVEMLRRGTLTVWVPDSTVRGRMDQPGARFNVPLNWKSLAEEFSEDFPDFDLRFQAMERECFIKAVHALPQKSGPPDVAFIDNYNELKPLLDNNAVVKMWGRSRFPENGWWVVLRHATNFTAAEAFMLWLEQSPRWEPWPTNTVRGDRESGKKANELAKEAARDFAKQDATALWSIMDPAAAHFQAFGADGPQALLSSEPLLSFGTSSLSFVLLEAVGQGERTFGMAHLGVVLRNTGAGWKVLLLLTDYTLPRLQDLFQSFDRLGLADAGGPPVPAVKLLAPDDHAQIPRYPYPEVEWTTAGEDVATYVIEFQFGQPGKEYWSASGITVVPPAYGDPTVTMEAPFHVGRQPHRWRVWAVSRAGVVSISDWRTVDYTT